jgi:hypothetical protein
MIPAAREWLAVEGDREAEARYFDHWIHDVTSLGMSERALSGRGLIFIRSIMGSHRRRSPALRFGWPGAEVRRCPAPFVLVGVRR